MCIMRLLVILLGIGYGLCQSLSASAQPAWQNQLLQPPEIKAEFVDGSLVPADAGSITFGITVQIPPDHHGYLDKGDEGLLIPLTFMFRSLEEHGAQVVMLSRPPGERDDNVRATVLRGKGEFAFRLEAEQDIWPTAGTPSAVIRYQICNDETNICYPPREIQVPLRFANFTSDVKNSSETFQANSQSPVVPLTIGERVTSLFQRYMRHFPMALGLVFLAGLIAVATPCVYPILPITSAILMARGGGSRRFGQLHAVVYFFGVIFFYTLLGFFASITGTALSTVMTNGWVNLAFAVIFVYFGLSMLGLYEFKFLPLLVAKLDVTSNHVRGFSGTFLMGSTAGLLASPCVGPVAGAILLQITGQAAGANLANNVTTFDVLLRGIALMTSFGAGLGIPFLAVGLVSHWLPQSGQWLSRVKFALGLPILYFAYIYYLKGMETVGVPEYAAHVILAGILAMGISVYIGAFHRRGATPPRGMLLRRALGIGLLIVGTHLLLKGLGQSDLRIKISNPPPGETPVAISATLQPATSHVTPPPQVEVHGNLRWLRNFPLALQRASLEQKPLFIDFYATWCANCKAFQKLAVTHTELNHALQQAVLVKIYDTDTIFPTFQQDHRYPELNGIGGQPFLPLFAIYSPQGSLTWKGQNYKAVHTMRAQLEHASTVHHQ